MIESGNPAGLDKIQPKAIIGGFLQFFTFFGTNGLKNFHPKDKIQIIESGNTAGLDETQPKAIIGGFLFFDP